MKRSIEQWRNCDPKAMAFDMSDAAKMYALQDAKADIAELYAENMRLRDIAQTAKQEFLLGGARLKLSFQQEECGECGALSAHFRAVPIDQYADELQGRWVALVAADNDRHLAPLQSCTEAEHIARIAALECELQAVKAEKRTAPEGWKLVPVNPTPAMLEAGKTITEYCHTANGWMPMRTSTYQIMVAAAPEAPK